jgi:putative transposase
MRNKVYKVRMYPNKSQKELITKTCGCVRFIYNNMLAERKDVYAEFKNNKELLNNHQYKTEKIYKQEFDFLKEVSSRALQQSRIDLNTAYRNFFKNGFGFPKFKKKGKSNTSYREPQTNNCISIKDRKYIKLLKLGWVKIKGLPSDFNGNIKSVTVSIANNGNYYASILVEQENIKKENKGKAVGIELDENYYKIAQDRIKLAQDIKDRDIFK